MTPEDESKNRMKIAHVLIMDVVEYSTLLITNQARVMAELTRVVKEAARFGEAEAEGKLLRLPTGDGMALSSSMTLKCRLNARWRSAQR